MKKQLWNLERVRKLTSQISIDFLGLKIFITSDRDKIYKERVYLQVQCSSPKFKGTKHYISPFSTESEIVFKAYGAFKSAIKYEIKKAFKVKGRILVNPDIDYKKLLQVSPYEEKRKEYYFDF